MDINAIAGAGMLDDQRRIEAISHNIANVLTPGYKRQVTLSPAFQVQLARGMAAEATLRMSAPQAAGSATIDPVAGPLRPTGNSSDVVIEGDSFFELMTPAGPAYTRQGGLRVDVSGQLVGSQGLPIMGSGGPISLGQGPFSVAANGDVSQGGRVLGQLRRVAFSHPEKMVAQGNGVYAQGGATVRETQASDRLRVGMQEASNVSSPQEMVRLTETMRHFEALQKIVQGYDESLEKAIRKLGDF
jgi:flagellar basal-body rod protein FlgF